MVWNLKENTNEKIMRSLQKNSKEKMMLNLKESSYKNGGIYKKKFIRKIIWNSKVSYKNGGKFKG